MPQFEGRLDNTRQRAGGRAVLSGCLALGPVRGPGTGDYSTSRASACSAHRLPPRVLVSRGAARRTLPAGRGQSLDRRRPGGVTEKKKSVGSERVRERAAWNEVMSDNEQQHLIVRFYLFI